MSSEHGRFIISPKTQASELSKVYKRGIEHVVRVRITDDIIGNAKDLAPFLCWEKLINGLVDPSEQHFRGRSVIERVYSYQLGGAVRRMNLGLDDPRVVAASAMLFINNWHLEEGLLTKTLSDAKDGKRRFVSSEAQEAQIAKENDRLTLLQSVLATLSEGLKIYEAGIPTSIQKAILEAIVSVEYYRISEINRRKLLSLLKENPLAAYTFLQKLSLIPRAQEDA